jgi:hypothetical protein
VTAIAANPGGTLLATGGQDSTIFFFSCQPQQGNLEPLCCVQVSDSSPHACKL